MNIHAPVWKPEVTAGNLVSWLLALFVAGGAVFVLKYQVDQLIAQSERAQIRMNNFETTTNAKISALESQLADSRVSSAEVRGSILAIERDIANIARNVEALQRAQEER